jgi:hypothetical protein
MMEHLNFCRQLTKQAASLISIPNIPAEVRTRALQLLDLSAISQKFMLPDGGHVIDDDELRGLGGDIPLRLPHPFVALEFRPLEADGSAPTSKTVLFVREHKDTDSICVTPAFFQKADGQWDWYDDALIPIHFYLNSDTLTAHGKPTLLFAFPASSDQLVYAQLVSVVLGFLNALSCSNVGIERSPARKSAKKAKDALPFDTYHVLTIDVPGRAGERGAPTGPHRAPREHLRRGHIRRLADGRRIWVNATVVSAGRGAGVVKKDYALRIAA